MLDPFAVELFEVQGREGELNDFGDQKRELASFSMFVKMRSPRLWLQTLKIIMITIVAKNRLYLRFKSDLIPGEMNVARERKFPISCADNRKVNCPENYWMPRKVVDGVLHMTDRRGTEHNRIYHGPRFLYLMTVIGHQYFQTIERIGQSFPVKFRLRVHLAPGGAKPTIYLSDKDGPATRRQ
jgi:hypothetical protein